MPRRTRSSESIRPPLAGLVAAVALALAAVPGHAEKADRTKPMAIESSGTQPGTVDLARRAAVFTGNVVVTQGTLQIHADRVEVSEDANGAQLGNAIGSAEHPATFRQKRDQENEWTEGEALRVEYDSAANKVRFIGAAHLRLLRGKEVTDEARAAIIVYDTQADTIALNGSGAAQGPEANGRTTVVFTPRNSASAPKAPGTAASAGAAR